MLIFFAVSCSRREEAVAALDLHVNDGEAAVLWAATVRIMRIMPITIPAAIRTFVEV